MATLQLGAKPLVPNSAARLGDIAAAAHPGFVSGRWYLPSDSPGFGTAAVTPGTGTLRFVPFYLKAATAITALAVNVVTAVAGSTFVLGIYANVLGLPNGPPLATVSGSGATVQAVSVSVSGLTLPAGWYWLAISPSSSTSQFTGVSATDPATMRLMGATTFANLFAATPITSWSVPFTYSATVLPTMSSGSGTVPAVASIMPAIAFQVGTTG